MPPDAIRRMKDAGHEVTAAEISLFEILAKGAKLVIDGKADTARVSLALKSILNDPSIGKASAYAEETMAMAIELRRHHSDFVDCLILASAANECDALVTEDAAISKNDGLVQAILRRNPKFKILTLKALVAGQR